jgi:hypothetical protein
VIAQTHPPKTMMNTFSYTNGRNHRLHCVEYRPPAGTRPKAALFLHHGIAEHIGRYDAGALVCDQRGRVGPSLCACARDVSGDPSRAPHPLVVGPNNEVARHCPTTPPNQ